VARRVPRFRGVFQSEQERNLVEWLKHPLEFGRPPDEIAVLDARDRPWPDHDDEVSCALFRFRYGADWQVGIVGPFTFSKEFPQDATVEMIYDGFESFQVGTVRELVKRDLGDAS
jgi:hypothetical protein